MAILTSSKGILKQKPRTIIYGAGGLGKDTFCAGFPKPLFIDEEGGTGKLDVERIIPKSFDETLSTVKAVAEEKHDYQSLTLSGLDRTESNLFSKILAEDPKSGGNMAKAAGGYGAGYKVSLQKFTELQYWLDVVQAKGMYVNIVCHELVYSYNDPMADAYDRYRLKLYEGSKDSAAKLWYDWADIVLFAKKKIIQKGEGRAMELNEGKHYIYTQGRAAFDAKSRFDLPFEMELNAATFLATLDAKPLPVAELYKTAMELAEKLTDAKMKEIAIAAANKNKDNAPELRGNIQQFNTLLAKEKQ